jgi:hypothetical protein
MWLQFVTFDSRLKRKSPDAFRCVADGPDNFVITAKPNASQALKSSLRLRRRHNSQTILSPGNGSASKITEKQRRSATPVIPSNESVCSDDVLHRVFVENVADVADVTLDRRIELDGDAKVCSTFLQLPFGYDAQVHVVVERVGEKIFFL